MKIIPKKIPYSTQTIDEQDILAVSNVLRSEFLTQGPIVQKFEDEISHYVGSRYSVSTNSATSALYIACIALGLKKGDYFWTSPISFVASANCGIYCGAEIDFVDIDINTYNISVEKLEEKLILAKKQNKLPKIVIPVHMAGKSCDMKKIYELSLIFGFKIIEDASHCIGGNYQNKKIGSCQYSHITVFSFHPVKIITTGEGGIILTNKSELYEKSKLIRAHGITKDRKKFIKKNKFESWYYEQQVLGFNYRMTDMEAALGSSQLKKIEKFHKKRYKIAKKYMKAFKGTKIFMPEINKDHALHLFIIRFSSKNFKTNKSCMFNFLIEKGINVNLHYIPIHLQPFYKNLGFKLGDFPVSEKYYSEAMSIPIFPTLNEADQSYVIDNILLIK